MPLKFSAPVTESPVPAASASCPPWLSPALAPDAAASTVEWTAALDGLLLFFIGDDGYEGLFHKQLFRAQDHFGSMTANVAVITKAVAGDSLLSRDHDLRFNVLRTRSRGIRGRSQTLYSLR